MKFTVKLTSAHNGHIMDLGQYDLNNSDQLQEFRTLEHEALRSPGNKTVETYAGDTLVRVEEVTRVNGSLLFSSVDNDGDYRSWVSQVQA